jgi:hypothetical protein
LFFLRGDEPVSELNRFGQNEQRSNRETQREWKAMLSDRDCVSGIEGACV